MCHSAEWRLRIDLNCQQWLVNGTFHSGDAIGTHAKHGTRTCGAAGREPPSAERFPDQRHCCIKGLSWIGVAHARKTSASGRHLIRVAVAFESEYADRVAVYQELSLAVNAVFAENSIGPHVTCEVIDANQITDVSAWVTAAGYHPVSGLLPAYIQLEHLNTGCAPNS